MKRGSEIKVVHKGGAQVMNAVEITAENLQCFVGAVKDPRVGMWCVSDLNNYVTYYASKEGVEKMFEHAPKRYSTRPGWLDRPPEEMQKR